MCEPLAGLSIISMIIYTAFELFKIIISHMRNALRTVKLTAVLQYNIICLHSECLFNYGCVFLKKKKQYTNIYLCDCTCKSCVCVFEFNRMCITNNCSIGACNISILAHVCAALFKKELCALACVCSRHARSSPKLCNDHRSHQNLLVSKCALKCLQKMALQCDYIISSHCHTGYLLLYSATLIAVISIDFIITSDRVDLLVPVLCTWFATVDSIQ